MVARIHHRKEGVEYVLQYKSRTDSIELRKNRYTLIGGIPNYFRHEWGTYVREMDFFKRAVLHHRPTSGLWPHRKLSDAEKDALHEFEKIAGVNLLFTPESIQRHRQSLTQGAANAFSEAARSFRETARTLPGIDTTQIRIAREAAESFRETAESFLIAREAGIPRQENEDDTDSQRRLADSMVTNFVVTPDMLAFPSRYADGDAVAQEENEDDTNPFRQRLRPRLAENFLPTGDLEQRLSDPPDPPPPTNAPPIAEETPSVNTEGMTEEEIQECQEFIQRLQNGESIPATEFPLRDSNPDTETPQNAEAAFDAFMKEIDEVLESDESDAETVRGAPSHYPEISAERMQSLWKQARQEDSDQ